MRYLQLAISILFFLLFQSCSQETKLSIVSSEEILIDTTSGSCPFITKNNQGNIVISWVKKMDTTASIYCYAVSTDEGKTFGKAIEIPASININAHAENLPKIVFKPSGEIIAVWGAANPNPNNAYSGMVFYNQSFDEGKTWSKAIKLVTDTAGFDQRYFDVALLPDGEAAVIWLDNRRKTGKEGSALYMAKTNCKNGFVNEHLISEPCCECCRTDLFVDSKSNIHVLYRAILDNSIRDMVHAVSVDGGQTFSTPKKISDDNWVINGCPHTGPAMTENKSGVHFAWFTAGAGPGVFYNHSTDDGKTFSGRDSLSGRTGRHPQIATFASGDIVIVWDEKFEADKKLTSRIGLQLRQSDGTTITKDFPTPDNSNATYPVISAINNSQCIVAYAGTSNNKSQVFYKLVSLSEVGD